MPQFRILVVEDEIAYRLALEKFLKKDFDVTVSTSIKDALFQLNQRHYDLCVLDLKLPDGNGMELLVKLQRISPGLVTIVMTGHGDSNIALEAIRKGAFHYLTKPFQLDELKHLIVKALTHTRLEKENYSFQRELKHKYQFDNIIGSSPSMLEVFKLIEKVSLSDSTVLIQGESGTGKELVARAIHYNSARANKPLIAVNCGALPEELLESELFGHVKGAYTGAHVSRQGRFELADQGTIFLDEVADMSLRLQVKLLRVIQEQKFEPVGMSEPREVNVRILAATHQDLETAVKEKKFRQDLYYRLNVIPMIIPPLRERSGDIPLLLKYFLEKFNQEKKKKVKGFTEEAFEILSHYSWPGNIRELENLMERLVILKGEGELGVSDLPHRYFSSEQDTPSYPLPPEGMDFNEFVKTVETDLIRQALIRTKGNRNQAARLLKLKRTTLVEKLKRKRISR